MKSRIWRAGNSYQTTVPPFWVEKHGKALEEGQKYEVDKTLVGELFILSEPYNEFSRSKTSVKISDSDEADLRAKIINSYLAGFDDVSVQFQKGVSAADYLEKIEKYVPGTSVEQTSDENLKLTFAEKYEVRIADIVDSTRNMSFKELSLIIKEALGDFPDIGAERLAALKKKADNYERNLDGIGFYLNRQLSKAISYPELLNNMGIDRLENCPRYNMLITYMERVGDLHVDILSRVTKLLESEKKDLLPQLRSFYNYYEESYKILNPEPSYFENRDARLDVIRNKMKRWKDTPLDNAGKKTTEQILKTGSPTLIRHLTILEGKIQAIPDVTSNICEIIEDIGAFTKRDPPTEN